MADAAWGLWPLVVLNTALFVVFAVSFFRLAGAARGCPVGPAGHHRAVRTRAPPQYDGSLLVMVGFLLQWPTILTLVMFPILALVYARLAHAEEREVAARFGKVAAYDAHSPAFIPAATRRHHRDAAVRRPRRTRPRPATILDSDPAASPLRPPESRSTTALRSRAGALPGGNLPAAC